MELATEHVRMWWITLGLGLVVAVVVVALLQALLRIVKGIDEGVATVWESGKQVAANTATVWMIGHTADLAGKLGDELAQHRGPLKGGR